MHKPTISKLLDKTIEYLHLNNRENSYKITEQTENCILLHNAIAKNYENIFQLLLKCGFNPNSLLSDHKTPLLIAVVSNNIHPTKRLEYIQFLIAYGANAIIPDNANVSPFKRLCGMGRFMCQRSDNEEDYSRKHTKFSFVAVFYRSQRPASGARRVRV